MVLSDRLAGLKVDRLRSFLAVVRHGSFSAAGNALFLSQPRVSSHIGDLERLFGTQLFDRSRHPITLTESGQRLLPHLQAAVEALGAAVHDAGDVDSGTLGGLVTIGMYPSAAAHLYGDLVREMNRTQPGVEVVLWEGSTLELGVALQTGDIDLAVRPALPAPDNAESVVRRTLWREPLVAVLPLDLLPSAPPVVRIGDLADQPIITIGSPQGPTRSTHGFESTAALEAAGILDAVAYRTNQPQTLVGLVKAGHGIGITNLLAVRASNREDVHVARLEGEGCSREVALWWRGGGRPPAAVEAVIDACERLPKAPSTIAKHPDSR